MTPQSPNWRQRTQALFTRAAFVQDLGIEMVDCGPGWCQAQMALSPRHLQQDGVVHAGVQATLADHCAGAAAMTLVAPQETVLSIEFKIHMLRPAQGERLWCEARVLKPGRRVSVVEAEVYALHQEERKLTAKLIASMIATAPPSPGQGAP